MCLWFEEEAQQSSISKIMVHQILPIHYAQHIWAGNSMEVNKAMITRHS